MRPIKLHTDTFRGDGFRDGYESVMSDTPRNPSPPDDPVYAAEYMEGWEAGIADARADYWAERQEREWNDSQAGL